MTEFTLCIGDGAPAPWLQQQAESEFFWDTPCMYMFKKSFWQDHTARFAFGNGNIGIKLVSLIIPGLRSCPLG